MKSKARRGVAISTDGKVLLSFQQQRSNAARLEDSDMAAFVRAAKEIEQATLNQQSFIKYLSDKYSLGRGDAIQIDGTINRTSRDPAPGPGLPTEGVGAPAR